jgi:hypothetical protein
VSSPVSGRPCPLACERASTRDSAGCSVATCRSDLPPIASTSTSSPCLRRLQANHGELRPSAVARLRQRRRYCVAGETHAHACGPPRAWAAIWPHAAMLGRGHFSHRHMQQPQLGQPTARSGRFGQKPFFLFFSGEIYSC